MSLSFEFPPGAEGRDPTGPRVRTVSELLDEVAGRLDEAFPEVWVRGEIVSLFHSRSGHFYFNLRDPQALVRCAFFRLEQNRRSRALLRDGIEVEIRGSLDLYAPRGEFQLHVLDVRPTGAGALLLAAEALKARLAAEGLFDPARKCPLPRFPRAVGLVTSSVGAALHDVLHVFDRRWPGLRVVLAPCRVQGDGAAEDVAGSIERLDQSGLVEVIVVTRGGGSFEDLWAFQSERVVRAVAQCATPIVSAVGHEVDVTLCDFAADVRAATPTAAAEILTTPDRDTVLHRVSELALSGHAVLETRIGSARERLVRLRRAYGFRRPGDLIAAIRQRLDAGGRRLRQSTARLVRGSRLELGRVRARYGAIRLVERAQGFGRERSRLASRLAVAGVTAVGGHRTRLVSSAVRLEALSPRAVLARGYAIVLRADGTLVRAASTLRPDEVVGLELALGRARARVLDIDPGPKQEV